MVDRIDKTERADYWKISSTAETHKDKEQQGESQGKDAFASLSEKTNWKLLFDKSQLWKRNIQISQDEIQQIIFKKINLKTDPSLLRVDVHLKNGEKISPAFLAVSRHTGLKLKNLNPFDPIPTTYEMLLMPEKTLRITIPTNPQMFAEEEKRVDENQKIPPLIEDLTVKNNPSSQKGGTFFGLINPRTHKIRMEMLIVYGVILLTMTLLIGGYFFIRSIQ